MSPIKDPSVYPDDWRARRERILERSVSDGTPRCECQGECGADHALEGFLMRTGERCVERQYHKAEYFNGRVILTLAHVNHDASSGDHSLANLKAMCQRCHLRYDAEYRRQRDSGQSRLIG